MTLLERIAGDWTGLRLNLFSGLTVALAMVPEAIAFSFVAGVEPLVGLYAAFFMVLLTSIFGGRPGMISGATGALAVVMVALVAEHGVEYLFAAVILMGALQLLFGALRLGKFIRLVPHPVMLGFVNGLAIVILLSQLESFHTHDGWLQGKQLAVMIGLTALAVGLIIGLPKLNKNLPAPLLAIAGVAGVAAAFGLDARTVADLSSISGGFPMPGFPKVPWDLETLRIIFPYSLILAAVGLIETLLTLNLIDEVTEMEGLGEHLGILGRLGIRVQRHGCKTGDEHDLEVRIELGGPAGQFDAVHFGHDDVGQQQREGFLTQAIIGAGAIVEGADLVAGFFQRLDQKPAHVIVVFSEENFRVHSFSRPVSVLVELYLPYLWIAPVNIR